MIDRLLNEEEMEKLIMEWAHENWSTRIISLNRGHYEDVLPIIRDAQDKRSFKYGARAMRELILKYGSLSLNIDTHEEFNRKAMELMGMTEITGK